ncbi:MAG: STAS domain-containing protein [Actinomycetes bacterium]
MHVAVVDPGQVVVLDGRLDVRALPDVRDALQAAVDAGAGDLVLDVARLELRDAAGLGLLVGLHRRALVQGRRLVLANPPPRLARQLRIARLSRVLAVVESGGASAAPALV